MTQSSTHEPALTHDSAVRARMMVAFLFLTEFASTRNDAYLRFMIECVEHRYWALVQFESE